MEEKKLVLFGCGDVGPVHEPINAYSELVRPALAAADIRFAHCERVYSDLGSLQVHIDHPHHRAKPHMASVFSDCNFDVVSVAGNHAMDWGADALLDMMSMFRKRGILTVGGGRNIEEARQPAIIERNGVRVAILAYCSAMHQGYAATADKAGIAPLRAHTFYEPVDDQAGTPPRVVTLPYPADLQAMVEDIGKIKKTVHAVVVSFHWGVHFIPRMIADYQPIAAKAAFEAGADLILGHHPHIPKAIHVSGNKACFYSLGTFIMSTHSTPGRAERFAARYGVPLDPKYPLMPFGVDSKRSLIAKAVFSRQGLERVSYLPTLIDKQLRPQVLKRDDPDFEDIARYMESISKGYNYRPNVEGNEVVMS
jgi:hypothetical protein